MRSSVLSFVFMSLIVLIRPAWGLVFEASVPDFLVLRIQSDLDLVRRFDGAPASSLHRSIFGEISGANYLTWFFERVEQVGYRPLAGDNRGTTAYNDSSEGPRNHIVVTDWFAGQDLPQMARISILFHEARHSEQAHSYWKHSRCPKPFFDESGREVRSLYTGLPLAGESACDSTPLGAYGISVIMMMNLARSCRICGEKIRSDAALYAADQLKRLIRRSDRQRISGDRYRRPATRAAAD